MRMRISPSFVVAVMALVLASGSTGYAAAKITSKQIKNGTIQSKDVKDGSLTVADLAEGTLPSGTLADGSVTGAKVLDGSLGAADLGAGSVTGATVADGSLTSADLADGSVGRTDLNRACAGNEVRVFGGCVRRTGFGPSSHQAAIDDCNRRNGRLPTIAEARWIGTHDEFTWADGNVSQYEFTGDYTTATPLTPIGIDASGNSIGNASAQFFWHHCVTF